MISLFAGGIARSCGKYLRAGGYLLTNNHHGDAEDAAREAQFSLVTLVRGKRDAYRYFDAGTGQGARTGKSDGMMFRSPSSGALLFDDDEVYSIFRRLPAVR